MFRYTHSLQHTRCMWRCFCVHTSHIHTSSSTAKYNLWRWGSTSGPRLLSSEFGEISKTPKKISNFENSPISKISAGRTHSAFIIDGQLYTYGSNKYQQLGRHTEGEVDNTPNLVKFDGNVRISSVSCGSFHTAAISEEGLLYTWGWGGSTFYGVGGLGIGTKEAKHKPTLVQRLADLNEPVKEVACGHQHTLVLTETGKIFSTGKGEYGRLGRGRFGDQPLFYEIDYFSTVFNNTPIISICCGDVFSAALGENGYVWTWGRNDFGQLGHEDSMGDIYSNEIYPKIVGSLEKENQKILQISAGGYHMLSLSDTGLLSFWGGRAWLTPKNVVLHNIHPEKSGLLKIKKIAAGGYINFYSMIIDDEGSLFTWGRRQSQCLVRDVKNDENEPLMVDSSFFEGEKINDISCGHTRVIATTIAN